MQKIHTPWCKNVLVDEMCHSLSPLLWLCLFATNPLVPGTATWMLLSFVRTTFSITTINMVIKQNSCMYVTLTINEVATGHVLLLHVHWPGEHRRYIWLLLMRRLSLLMLEMKLTSVWRWGMQISLYEVEKTIDLLMTCHTHPLRRYNSQTVDKYNRRRVKAGKKTRL